MSKRKADFGTLEKENKHMNSFAHSWKITSLRSFFFFFFNLVIFSVRQFFFLTSKKFQSVGQLSSSCFEVFAKTALAPLFLFGSSLFLEVTKTSIISRMSSNFDQIRPLTAELSGLECLKNQYFVF